MEDNKYRQALKKHPLEFSDEEAKKRVEQIISTEFDENNNQDVYKKLYSCIDQTSLNTTDTKESIWKFTEIVNSFEGSDPEIGNVAAICVYPNFVQIVKESLTADLKIASVAGGFPSSQTFIEVKVAEVSLAIADGADEIDIVINAGLFLDEYYEEFCEEIMEIKEVCRDKTLKVILETGALITAKNIHNASILSMYSGADFLKTSTGKGYQGATPEAVFTMCHAIKSYYEETSNKIGIKVSGGVSTTEEAVKYYTIVKDILGDEWCNNDLFRIGTSRLAENLLNEIEKLRK
ncbi:MAG: deoxyribose-phosphate aldolase [Fermentimonas sp.]|nr:deoxyribose-phosphate aldolase [Fermentimonas sp.]MDD3188785.1 deoxyribose-phosphate aldolase [Fermentimonas sp.]MDD3512186.1 deoxyribose-phosphate aldolase [Fermentimonas sp.]MDD4284762.1 deoxyribose-phosphate aldolase [Fermentimonas sp.]MDD4724311.1 deoxyribose-phosphate aldolase [Fermentimonas sp.]